MLTQFLFSFLLILITQLSLYVIILVLFSNLCGFKSVQTVFRLVIVCPSCADSLSVFHRDLKEKVSFHAFDCRASLF